MKVVACRPAWVQTSNRFTHLFSQAVQDAGWDVQEFSWGGSTAVGVSNVILLHWPDELFSAKGAMASAKVSFKLALLRMAKLRGTKIVWVVHETRPHDIGMQASWAARKFIGLLDGAIYLSTASRLAAEADLPELKRVPALVTRHGHYRGDMKKAPQQRRMAGRRLDLVYFGQVRPYKNLDGLIRAAAPFDPADIQVKIIGWSKDADFTRSLEELAFGAPSVTLDIRDTFVPQADLEAALDESDGVVLPYRNILNSGAALFALSRNRPIMAPRLGTLPELREETGAEWVDLYDGDILEADLRRFAERLRQPRAAVCDLSRYEWDGIGRAIGKFFDQISEKRSEATAAALRSRVQP